MLCRNIVIRLRFISRQFEKTLAWRIIVNAHLASSRVGMVSTAPNNRFVDLTPDFGCSDPRPRQMHCHNLSLGTMAAELTSKHCTGLMTGFEEESPPQISIHGASLTASRLRRLPLWLPTTAHRNHRQQAAELAPYDHQHQQGDARWIAKTICAD
jgi:hypothetical protein